MHQSLRVLVLGLSVTGCMHHVPMVNTTDVSNVDFSRAHMWTRGQACEVHILILGPFGDSSIKRAAQAAKLSRVFLVENYSEFFLIGSKDCTIVYGETGTERNSLAPSALPRASTTPEQKPALNSSDHVLKCANGSATVDECTEGAKKVCPNGYKVVDTISDGGMSGKVSEVAIDCKAP